MVLAKMRLCMRQSFRPRYGFLARVLPDGGDGLFASPRFFVILRLRARHVRGDPDWFVSVRFETHDVRKIAELFCFSCFLVLKVLTGWLKVFLSIAREIVSNVKAKLCYSPLDYELKSTAESTVKEMTLNLLPTSSSLAASNVSTTLKYCASHASSFWRLALSTVATRASAILSSPKEFGALPITGQFLSVGWRHKLVFDISTALRCVHRVATDQQH